MSIQEVQKLLVEHAEALQVSPPLPMVKPGQPYKPQVGKSYLEVLFAPGETQTPFIGDGDPKLLQGFLQVTFVGPRVNFNPWEVVAVVIDHFRKGTILRGEDGVNVKILREPWASTPFDDEGWSRVPVSIPYLCFA